MFKLSPYKMKKNLFFIIFVISLLFILNASYALAVGVSAYDLTPQIDFVPGTVKRFPFQLQTTVNAPMDYKVRIMEGPLRDIASTDPPVLEDVMPGSNPWFDVILEFEDDSSYEPGMYELRFGVMEASPIGGGAGAKTGVTVPIFVRVLSEDKSAKLELDVPNINQGQDLKITSKVSSWSKVDIDEAYVKMDLIDPEGNIVKTMETDKVQVPSAKSKELLPIITPTSSLLPGIYKLSSTLYYDGKTEESDTEFRIGEYSVDIINMTKQVPPGGIRKVESIFSSRWNNKIENVYYDLSLDVNNTKIESKSESFVLAPLETKKVPLFIDLTDVKEGKYSGFLTLYYGNKTADKSIELIVSEKEILEEMPMMYIIGAVVVLIVLLLILANIYFFMKSKKPKQERVE